MTIYNKLIPQSLDIVFSSTNPKELKEIHTIMRENISGYLGFRLNKKEDYLELHAETEPSAWIMERTYKALEDWAYGHLYPKADDGLDKSSDDLD